MTLSKILSEISLNEIVDARKQAAHLSRKGRPLTLRTKQIIKKYPAIVGIMTMPARSKHPLLTKGIIDGYRSACHLIAALAERRGNAALASSLFSITKDEIHSAVEKIFSTDKMTFARWFCSCGQNYCGYVTGMWEEFEELLRAEKTEQSMGHLIIVGGLIIIAENRDGARRRNLSA